MKDSMIPIVWRVTVPDSEVHGANMGPIWGQQDPDGIHVGPINFAIWCTDTVWPPAVANAMTFGTSSFCCNKQLLPFS